MCRSRYQKNIFFKEGAVTSIIHFRYFFKNKNPVFEVLYQVQPSESSRIISTIILYTELCAFVMCSYMNFPGERILSFCQILEGACVPQVVKHHGFTPRTQVFQQIGRERRILVCILMGIRNGPGPMRSGPQCTNTGPLWPWSLQPPRS